jgi:ankyrin repeat protein
MNKFVRAIKDLDIAAIEKMLPKWIGWSERDGKNALHYLCGVNISGDAEKAETSLQILKLFLKNGMDINSLHFIPDPNCDFPATPLWYAYTRGRNEKLYKFLLKNGAGPDGCMFAIAWYDDAQAAELFRKHGAKITDESGQDTPFLAAFGWKKFNMAEWFLKNGANVNVTDEKGNTALFCAVKQRQKYDEKDIELLLEYGADVDKENAQGISPKKLAEAMKRRKIFKLFEAR